jgi:PAT family beta-lactamase induction signal transducer AmpG
MLSGYFSDLLGYRIFFIWVLIATIPAFLAAWFVPFGHPDNVEQKELDNSATN